MLDFDITSFLNPVDPWPTIESLDNIVGCYRFKSAVSAVLRPASILEMGVRYGYSAAAFLAASPNASFYGVDADNGLHGGVEGAMAYASTMLTSRFPGRNIKLKKLDTQEADPDGSGYELIHVDADHSYAGCLNDLWIAARLGTGWILVDDISHLASVAKAVRDFLVRSSLPHVYFPSLRGDCLIQLDGGRELTPAMQEQLDRVVKKQEHAHT